MNFDKETAKFTGNCNVVLPLILVRNILWKITKNFMRINALVILVIFLFNMFFPMIGMAEDIDFALDRVIVKYKTEKAFDSDRFVISHEIEKGGVRISGVRIINPALDLSELSFGNLSNQNKIAVYILEEPGAVNVAKVLRALSADDDVEYAERDYFYYKSKSPDDPFYPQSYGLEKISAPLAWDVSEGNDSIVVGVIDTGIDFSHEDLIDNMWINPYEGLNGYEGDINGYDFVNRTGEVKDTDGHGTHVAGIIGSVGNNTLGTTGVNWNIKLASLNVFGGNDYACSSAIIEALNYSVNMGMIVTNNSYTGKNFSRALRDTISDSGVFVTSAGNGMGNNNDVNPVYPGNYGCDNIITVAASDKDDNLAWFSNYGKNTVHVAAPGVDIFSTLPGNGSNPNGRYVSSSGTSQASAYVAGSCALILPFVEDFDKLSDAGERITAYKSVTQNVKNQILENVDPLTHLNGKLASSGRLNAYFAIAPFENDGVSSVSISGADEDIALKIHEHIALSATVDPVEFDQTVEWSSSNTDVAVVDYMGNVNGVSAGTAVITAAAERDKSKFAQCTVTVSEEEIPKIEFEDSQFKTEVLALLSAIDPIYTERTDLYPYDALKLNRMHITSAGISSVKGIEYFKNVKDLNLDSNEISKIDISGLENLERVVLSRNRLTDVNVNGLSKLEYLDFNSNFVSDFGISGLSSLKELYCHYNELVSLDLRGAQNLERLNCSNNLLESVTANNPSLVGLYINNNRLESINLQGFPSITALDVSDNNLTELDISQNYDLEMVTAYSNGMKTFKSGYNFYLMFLYIGDNELEELVVSGLTELVLLDCSSNLLSRLDVSENEWLSHLYCANNNLIELIIEEDNYWDDWLLGIGSIYCDNNYLSEDDILWQQLKTLTDKGVEVVRGTQRKLHPDPEYITINSGKSLTIDEGDSVELTAVIAPANALQEFVWSSENEETATVENGIITGIWQGSTIIRAAATVDSSVYAEVSVNVVPKTKLYLELSNGNGIVCEDGKFNIPVAFSGIQQAVNEGIGADGGLYEIALTLDYPNQMFDLAFESDLMTWDGTHLRRINPITSDSVLGNFVLTPKQGYVRDNYEVSISSAQVNFDDGSGNIAPIHASLTIRDTAYIFGKSLMAPVFDIEYSLEQTIKEGDIFILPTALNEHGEVAVVTAMSKTTNIPLGQHIITFMAEDTEAPGLKSYIDVSLNVVHRLSVPQIKGSEDGSRWLYVDAEADNNTSYRVVVERSIDGYRWTEDIMFSSVPFKQKVAVAQKAGRGEYQYRAYAYVIHNGKRYLSPTSEPVEVKRHNLPPVLSLTGELVNNYFFSQIYSEIGVGAQATDAVTGSRLETARITKSYVEKTVAGARRKLEEGKAVPSPVINKLNPTLEDLSHYEKFITEYTVLYTVTDDCGNTASVSRVVAVRGELGDIVTSSLVPKDFVRTFADYLKLRDYVVKGLKDPTSPTYGFLGEEDIYRANLSGLVWDINDCVPLIHRIALEDCVILRENILGSADFQIEQIFAGIDKKRMSEIQKSWERVVVPE